MNSEIALINDLLSRHSVEWVRGYLTAFAISDTPPNNGIDYKWTLDWFNKRYKPKRTTKTKE